MMSDLRGGPGKQSRELVSMWLRLCDPYTYIPWTVQPDKSVIISVSTPNGAENKFAKLMPKEGEGGVWWHSTSVTHCSKNT